MTRATLHDELMRAAGFDVGYYQELARRRARRRRRFARAAPFFGVALVGTVTAVFEYLRDDGRLGPATIAGIVVAVLFAVLGVARKDED